MPVREVCVASKNAVSIQKRKLPNYGIQIYVYIHRSFHYTTEKEILRLRLTFPPLLARGILKINNILDTE